MTNKCSCGARDKSKCSKENGLGSGKMCLRDGSQSFDKLSEMLWKNHPDEMAEAKLWAEKFIEEIKNEPNN